MKLIIDIYEDQYEFIKQGMSIKKVMEYPALMEAICEYISNGIPLDKIKSEIKAYAKHPLTTKEEMYCLSWVVNMLDGSMAVK